MKPIHMLFRKVVKAEQAKGAHLNETLYGMKTIKSLSLEGRRRRDWDHLVADAISARHNMGLMANYPDTLALPFHRLIQSGCMFFGAYLYLYYVDMPNPRFLDYSRCPDGLLFAVRPAGPASHQCGGCCSEIWPRCEVPSVQWHRS